MKEETKVKAWGIYHLKKKDLADTIYETKGLAYYSMLKIGFTSGATKDLLKRTMENYKIIPIEITYKV